MGEEKWQQRQAEVKESFAKKFGPEAGEKVWQYKNDFYSRFKEMRKGADEEMGVIRNGMAIPEIGEKEVDFFGAEAKTSTLPAGIPPPPPPGAEEEKEKLRIKGWWSEPESRFKKG